MFKNGEKVVCIDVDEIISNNNNKTLPPTTKLEKYKTYTVIKCYDIFGFVFLDSCDVYFSENRFMSLNEYRRHQIYKIRDNIK